MAGFTEFFINFLTSRCCGLCQKFVFFQVYRSPRILFAQTVGMEDILYRVEELQEFAQRQLETMKAAHVNPMAKHVSGLLLDRGRITSDHHERVKNTQDRETRDEALRVLTIDVLGSQEAKTYQEFGKILMIHSLPSLCSTVEKGISLDAHMNIFRFIIL